MPNRLANETSPYLAQHKDNPVDWYPWGEEAFTVARAENKPILLSVGYSACHWCHVMAHESFEDEATAELMNRWFVNIKVDREERPDIDGIYMLAVQALTGRGGWPMTVWLDHEARPFYAGTYFPREDGHGLPGFPRVLEALHGYWVDERERLVASAEGITDRLRRAAARPREDRLELTEELVSGAVDSFARAFDPLWGGFGQAPKFPSPGNLEFLLAHAARMQRSGREDGGALRMVLTTLRGMASGGMYDQAGGGFARYSVDARWIVPHFEKMLYDNAQLARVFLHAWQMTGESLFERIVRETLAYLQREMLDPSGGFYAAQDADSEGIEGKFFVWTPEELRDALGPDAALGMQVFGVTAEGNFEDPHHPEFGRRSVLTRRHDEEAVRLEFGLSQDQLVEKIEQMRARLYAARERRIHPGLDDKVLTSWNGLALAAFAEAARVLGDKEYRQVAEANAAFVRHELWRDGRLLHTWKAGIAKVDGMIDDYAFLGLGLIDLYRLTGDLAHLEWARELFAVLREEFWDGESGGFFETAAGGEQLLVRQKSFFDDATPSGNGAVAQLAFWLGRYFEADHLLEVAHEGISPAGQFLAGAPTGFGALWQVVELLLAPRQELVISGGPEQRRGFEQEAARHYRPWLVLAPGSAGLPLFAGRESDSEARAYLCENMTCGLAAETAGELARQLT